jgi:hypothetical protein
VGKTPECGHSIAPGFELFGPLWPSYDSKRANQGVFGLFFLQKLFLNMGHF